LIKAIVDKGYRCRAGVRGSTDHREQLAEQHVMDEGVWFLG
jgi:hypothetical protein